MQLLNFKINKVDLMQLQHSRRLRFIKMRDINNDWLLFDTYKNKIISMPKNINKAKQIGIVYITFTNENYLVVQEQDYIFIYEYPNLDIPIYAINNLMLKELGYLTGIDSNKQNLEYSSFIRVVITCCNKLLLFYFDNTITNLIQVKNIYWYNQLLFVFTSFNKMHLSFFIVDLLNTKSYNILSYNKNIIYNPFCIVKNNMLILNDPFTKKPFIESFEMSDEIKLLSSLI
jgi:hypothetical protein